MSDANFFVSGRPGLSPGLMQRTEYVVIQKVLHRILAFTGRTIDDVVNNPVAANQVRGYFKLHKWVERESEISDMEKSWNPLGRRT